MEYVIFTQIFCIGNNENKFQQKIKYFFFFLKKREEDLITCNQRIKYRSKSMLKLKENNYLV